ncbi:MAG TPA: anaerobic sulfatase maturase [Tepidisphaeraceae bacterium]|nr:anaerobic sulfatase maturase [Tepidisphaeraceae bacterium]
MTVALPTASPRPFHVMTKPIGPICNLDCKYCFYLEKEKLYPDEHKWRMSDEVLEAYIRQYIESQPVPQINFAWQGGEPTLLGVDYFRKVVELQTKYSNGKRISNAIQTNGTLLDDEWCEFLARHQFLVGLSIDGPREVHDAYRVDKKQQPTFDDVIRGLELLKKHKAEFNTLTVVNRLNSQHPLKVYNFLKEIGSGFIQFIPLVERLPQLNLKIRGMDFAEPPVHGTEENLPVTEWSLRPKDYGEFLVQIFDQWVRHDVGQVFVQLFDVALGNWMGVGSSLCVFAEKCGAALAIEHNGDLYSCDHYVYSQYHLGNILNHSLGEMVNSEQQTKFGSDKSDTLPNYCKTCEVRFACNGECPKHRFAHTPDGEAGLNYLCPAYKRFFNHIDPYMKMMAQLVNSKRPAAMIMEYFRQQEQRARVSNAGRNDPCPCGSGKKFKKCCGM